MWYGRQYIFCLGAKFKTFLNTINQYTFVIVAFLRVHPAQMGYIYAGASLQGDAPRHFVLAINHQLIKDTGSTNRYWRSVWHILEAVFHMITWRERPLELIIRNHGVLNCLSDVSFADAPKMRPQIMDIIFSQLSISDPGICCFSWFIFFCTCWTSQSH